MYFEKKVYLIVCEGSSEKAYIQELNKFLNKNEYNFTLIPHVIGSGHCKIATEKYKTVKKNNPRQIIKIWVDRDTYIRNDQNDATVYKKKSKSIPDFFFSLQNFEDFLAMHMDDKNMDTWAQECFRHSHHKKPMQEDEYLPLFRECLFGNYEKGQIPFEITQERLNNLFIHNNDKNCFFKCDFATFLEGLMKKYPPINL